MLVFEAKLKGKAQQYKLIMEAIRTGQFIRNACLKYWMESNKENKIDRFSLNKYTKVLADNPEFPWVSNLNSMARQAQAERAWLAIKRFFDNCKAKIPGKKGYPRFKKHSRSVEYKTSGWKLSDDRNYLTLTDGFGIGRLKLIGTRDLNFYNLKQIKRIRLVKRADGYYVQFCIDVERNEKQGFSGKQIGVDLGLAHFYTDSKGEKVENPRHLRSSEKRLKRLQRRMSRRYRNLGKGKKGSMITKTNQDQSKRFHKARERVARMHLKVSRQRRDFTVKLARCVIQSNDLVAYEDLKVRNMVRNRKLAKSISDAGWSQFREWLEYFAKVFGKLVIAVPPHYTSQNCSGCGEVVKKSLSVRTHECPACEIILDRDENAAINILLKALEMLDVNPSTVGHTGTNAQGQNHLCLISESLLGKWTG